MVSALTFSEPKAPLASAVERPFGVFLDAGDEDWGDDDFLRRSCLALMKAGCRWFVCFGPRAEAVHDRIDDFIVEHGYDGVVTTYHSDESEEDAAVFFTDVALMEMKGGLVLVRDRPRWARHFEVPSQGGPQPDEDGHDLSRGERSQRQHRPDE